MKFGAGKPAKFPAINSVRELTPTDLQNFKPGRDSTVQKFRDSHHRLARLIALGLKTHEVAEASGYSITHISILKSDPAFQDLVATYRDQVDATYRDEVAEYYANVAANRTAAARLINDALSIAEPGDIPLRTLVAIHADAADRTGFGKRQTVDVNIDFASQLDKAIKRVQELKASSIVDAEFVQLPSPEKRSA
jgi:hypothetical protein